MPSPKTCSLGKTISKATRARYLQLNPDSNFFKALKDLALDETIAGYLSRYADFDFDIDYDDMEGHFPQRTKTENIKISRGEQNIFIWCLFMAICERMLDGHESYQSREISLHRRPDLIAR